MTLLNAAPTQSANTRSERVDGDTRPLRVFLCEGEGIGWALDEDRRLTGAALASLAPATTESPPIIRLVNDIRSADVVHSVWWEILARIPADALVGKTVICQLCGDVARCMADPRFALAVERVTHWIAQSRKAAEEMRLFADSVHFVPYALDWKVFAGENGERSRTSHPGVAKAEAEVARLRARGALIIGSIARDTEGWSLDGSGATKPAPKLVKGPDVLLEIVTKARDLGVNVGVLLAGPRRHWLRAALRARDIPVVFAGDVIAGDDFANPGVMLAPTDVAHLYSLMDLHLCPSRSEGGPRPILEAAAAGCPQLSTPVGHAPDILHPDCLFTDPIDAAEKIRDHARTGVLRRFVPIHRETVRAVHTIDAIAERWRAVYTHITDHATEPPAQAGGLPSAPRPATATRRLAVWFRYQDGAWGGGNQFHKALRAELERRGIEIVVAPDDPDAAERCPVHFAESLQFDEDVFRRVVDPRRHHVVHRFDGPVSMLRRTAESWDLDRRILALSTEFASWSVMQSIFSVRRWAALGLPRRRMVVVPNAPDPALFHTTERPAPSPDRLRVVATSWAPNPGKGAPVYAWMGEHLDPARFELTFVGRVENAMPGWTIKEPVGSGELGDELRTHDVYVTASREDPCSNSLCEALATGLPALYLRDGGHPELVGPAGLSFDLPAEIPSALARLHQHWPTYRSLIAAWNIARVADVYERVLFPAQT